jgi:membrane associated rhomboid family serine protease
LELADGVRVLPVWITAVVAGALVHAAYYGADGPGLVGGSAGVYGILTAHFADIALNFDDIPRWFWQMISYGALAVPPIAHYILIEYSNISHAAHAGGALGGLIGGFIFLVKYHETKRERALRIVVPLGVGIGVFIYLF